jgi:hypothetical protein
MAKVKPAKVAAKSVKLNLKVAQKLAQRSQTKRPRGRPFEKGHEFGFKKGASGNPSGRPKNPRPTPVYVNFKDKLTEELLKPANSVMKARVGLQYRHVTKYDCIVAMLAQTAAEGDIQAAFGIRNVIEGLLPTKNFSVTADMQSLLADEKFVEWLRLQHGTFSELGGNSNDGRQYLEAAARSLPDAENPEDIPRD